MISQTWTWTWILAVYSAIYNLVLARVWWTKCISKEYSKSLSSSKITTSCNQISENRNVKPLFCLLLPSSEPLLAECSSQCWSGSGALLTSSSDCFLPFKLHTGEKRKSLKCPKSKCILMDNFRAKITFHPHRLVLLVLCNRIPQKSPSLCWLSICPIVPQTSWLKCWRTPPSQG